MGSLLMANGRMLRAHASTHVLSVVAAPYAKSELRLGGSLSHISLK